jgi:putative RecB family exonuclease
MSASTTLSGDFAADSSATGDHPPDEPAPLRLSFSKVDAYQQCPLKYRFAYVDGVPTAPSPDLSWGKSLHNALETWWDRKLPEPPGVEVLFDALYHGWDDTGFAELDREEKLKWYGHARDVLARHHERYAPSYVPAVATEEFFTLDMGQNIEVAGVIDHVARTDSGGLGIVDWKTNRKAKPRRHVAASLQLALYTLAAEQLWGQEPEWVALDFLVPGVRVQVAREEIDTDVAVATVRAVAEEIRQGSYEPTPSKLCGWCDYRSICPAFDGEGPDVPGYAAVELEQLRRRRERDEARIAHLETIIRDRLGPEASVAVDGRSGKAGS